MFLTTTWFGCFVLDNGKVVDHRIFPKDPNEIAEHIRQVQNGIILEEERELAGGVESIFVGDHRLGGLKNAKLIDLVDPGQSADQDFIPDPQTYSMPPDLLREALILVASGKLRKAYEAREIIELIAVMDDLNKAINLLHEREAEWGKVYGDQEPPDVLRSYRSRVLDLEATREELKTAIEVLMKKENPTLSHLVGELLGARIIALGGGRERLARLPAGTIQILGAESAFFRFRKTGKGMPKHGIIFQHPWIKTARKDQRGKIARTLAGKIALAARIDHYSERNDGEILRNAVEKRINDLPASDMKKKNRANK